MTASEKFTQMFAAILLFAAVVGIILFIAGRFGGRNADRIVAAAYLAPTLLALIVGLLYPGLRTIYQSFFDAAGNAFIGIDNYKTIFTDSDQLTVLRNTVFWVVLTPFVATAIGLLYAILVDKAKMESLAKALIFLPMAISFVGASMIWKFVYEFRPDQAQRQADRPAQPGAGVAGRQPAAVAGRLPAQHVPADRRDDLDPGRLRDDRAVGGHQGHPGRHHRGRPPRRRQPSGMFRFVTLPSIRPAVVVVLTTIGIGTLKVFDIVRTMTGGQFNTSVIANEFYSQSFRSDNQGLGAALAVLLFVLVIPIVVYNIRQLRASEAR